MNIFEKIKLWFTSISGIVNFLLETFKEAGILADKKANFKTWTEFVIAFIQDALQYAEEIASLTKETAPIQTKGQVIKAVKKSKTEPISTKFRTKYFITKVEDFNK